MTKEQFDKKFARLFCMWVDALKVRNLELQEIIIKMEEKLIVQYQLQR